jgi:hypothetical protein
MSSKSEKPNPAALAVMAAGSQEKLAQKLGGSLTRQAIALWVRNGRIPLRRVVEVSRVTGIPKSLLSPDFRD